MSTRVGLPRFGTMGWAYDDWRDVFYSRDVAQARMLEEYATVFNAVELDTTFYGVPRPSTLDGWNAATPPDFRFSAKAPKAITHERRLRFASEAALDFGGLLRERLGEKLGALLLQLPPDFTADADAPALTDFCGAVASARRETGLPWVVEFRDDSWRTADIVTTLHGYGFSVATTERLDLGGPLRYLRLLGIENSVARFNERQIPRDADLDLWATKIAGAIHPDADPEPTADPRPVFVFVRNFFEGHAPATLFELRRRVLPVGSAPPVPPGQRQMSLF
jgi:uncharacterized protein YecE (DUF72 family)